MGNNFIDVAAKKRLVVLESPYAGKGRFWIIRLISRIRNIRYARRCVRDSLLRGEAPIASHLLYTQRGILSDDAPLERTLGIKSGLAWLAVAEATVAYVDRGESSGMKLGILSARAFGKPIEYRRID